MNYVNKMTCSFIDLYFDHLCPLTRTDGAQIYRFPVHRERKASAKPRNESQWNGYLVCSQFKINPLFRFVVLPNARGRSLITQGYETLKMFINKNIFL